MWIAGILLAVGIVLGGVGWLTGASLTRMADILFGGTEEAYAALNAVLARGTEMIRQITELFGL